MEDPFPSWQELNSTLKIEGALQFRTTKYYYDTIKKNPKLLKMIIPEMEYDEGFEDPLAEDSQSPVEGIVHRYPDRVLFLVSDFCASNCQYCTRSRMINQRHKIKADWDKGFEYIKSHPEIRDVVISGGDPLTLSNSDIEYILTNIRNIPHVEIIRIGTKVPVVMPSRIDTELVSILKKFHPLYINIHFIHADEITDDTRQACAMLADAGIPLGSQTVMLKDINDTVDEIKHLYHELLMMRVKPYILYFPDLTKGTKRFWNTIDKGMEIMRGLRGWTSGMANPYFIVDSPGGKIPILPEYAHRNEDGSWNLKDYKGNQYEY